MTDFKYRVVVTIGGPTGNTAIDPESEDYELNERLSIEIREAHLIIKNAQTNGIVAIYAPGTWRSAKREKLQIDS